MTKARESLLDEPLGAGGRLFVVSNRGPITFEVSGTGCGGSKSAPA